MRRRSFPVAGIVIAVLLGAPAAGVWQLARPMPANRVAWLEPESLTIASRPGGPAMSGFVVVRGYEKLNDAYPTSTAIVYRRVPRGFAALARALPAFDVAREQTIDRRGETVVEVGGRKWVRARRMLGQL